MSDTSKRNSFATRSYPAAILDRHNGLGQLAGPLDGGSWRFQSQTGMQRLASIMGQGIGASRVPPLARMAMATGVGDLGDYMRPAGGDETRLTGTRPRSNEWYQEHCVTCYNCHTPVTANPEKRGKQCNGCRKWFHRHCLPGGAASAAVAAAAAALQPDRGAQEEAEEEVQAGRPLFYHAQECQKVHQRLQGQAGEGPTKLRARSAAPQDTWRLLDFTTIKGAYKTAARLGGGVVAKRATRAGEGGGGAVPRPLDDFLDVMELLNGVVEEPVGDVLEDSFGVLVKRGGKPVAAATFNLYGRDHARLQSLVTSADMRRRGHARGLVQHLQDQLRQAGVKQLVALIEPEVGDVSAAKRLFYSQGYQPASAEQRMVWRSALPEYHRNLVNGCELWVKDLALPAKKGWGFF